MSAHTYTHTHTNILFLCSNIDQFLDMKEISVFEKTNVYQFLEKDFNCMQFELSQIEFARAYFKYNYIETENVFARN